MEGRQISDSQWRQIEGILPGRPGSVGVTARDNRLFVDGVLWVLRSGAEWKDLPEEGGKWKTSRKRYARWARAGIWKRVFQVLPDDPANRYVMIDFTIVGTHQQAACGKGGQGEAVGRSRGGLSAKIRMVTDAQGQPVRFALTGGQEADAPQAIPLPTGIETEGGIADKGHESNGILDFIQSQVAEVVIPLKSNRRDPWECDRQLYRTRNLIERAFNKLKQWRRLATRYDRRSLYFLSAWYLVAAIIWSH